MMWDHPGIERYLESLRDGHMYTFWANVSYSIVKDGIGAIESVEDRNIEIVSGSIQASSEQDTRYTGSLTLNLDINSDLATTDETDNFHTPTDKLNIYSTRINLFTGIVGVQGKQSADFVIPIGAYRVESASWGSNKLYEMELASYESYLIDYIYEHPISLAERYKGWRILDIIKAIIQETISNAVVDWSTLDRTYAAANLDQWRVYEGNDIREGSRWETVKFLAQMIDCTVYCGPDGVFYVKDRPERRTRYAQFPASWAVLGGVALTEHTWTPQDGRWSNTLVSSNISVSRDNVYNAVVVYNQQSNEDAPAEDDANKVPEYPYGIAVDMDPDSPIRWGGPFGRKPYRVEGDCVDKADCTWKAYYLLNDARGYNRTMDFSSVPNYALEPDDLIYVEEAPGQVVKHQVVSVSFPLGHSGGMTVGTKAKSELRLLTWEEIYDHRATEKPDGQPLYPNKDAEVPGKGDYVWSLQTKSWQRTRQIDDLTPKG